MGTVTHVKTCGSWNKSTWLMALLCLLGVAASIALTSKMHSIAYPSVQHGRCSPWTLVAIVTAGVVIAGIPLISRRYRLLVLSTASILLLSFLSADWARSYKTSVFLGAVYHFPGSAAEHQVHRVYTTSGKGIFSVKWDSWHVVENAYNPLEKKYVVRPKEILLHAGVLGPRDPLANAQPAKAFRLGHFRLDYGTYPSNEWFVSPSNPNQRIFALYVPHWFLLLFCLPFPALHLRRTLRQRKRRRLGLCLYCGYDLRTQREAASNTCPECGTAVPTTTAAPVAPRSREIP